MLVFLLIILTITAIVAGRIAMGHWFNHLSIYSLIWGSVLFFVHCGLIAYNQISGMAWCYILSAWLCLYLGSVTVLGIRGQSEKKSRVESQRYISRLKTVIWTFSLIGLVAVAAQVVAVIKEFGSLTGAVFAQANSLYLARLEKPELSGFSYVGSFAPAACTLAGVYAARMARLTTTALMPLLLVALSGILVMGRAGMIFAGIWFAAAFLHTPRGHFTISKWQAAVAIVLGIAVLAGGFIFISATRGLGTDFPGLSPAMERVSEHVPQLPSLFFWYTSPVVGFSDYVANPHRNPYAFWGMYTFAPLFRLASHLGIDSSVPAYEESYYTPRDTNVTTYLKNVHSDFGAIGTLVFPYTLGALMTWLKLRLDEELNFSYIVILAHCYVVVMFSFAFNPMLMGEWYISLALGLAACFWITRCPAKAIGSCQTVSTA